MHHARSNLVSVQRNVILTLLLILSAAAWVC